MVAIYENKGAVPSTTFRMSENLQYKLFHNEDGFRYVQYKSNGQEKSRVFWVDIPEEIASALATDLLKMRDNGLIKKI